ncbi:glycerophosphoryl diester phosphodiesterase [Atopostipes suicloacalis DSM 15692]|uniref:Glycerophosphoryl diester phosphodiesterase n=1 Tax=Atopostipes suicloacalis DSM 15692 TaxID=1121025 RepID=A0A1M4Z034_9LACT|nr:glycerophosphodiester phosphodiesterase [Atopostipes suicloacalis]SHF11414.1 glycerophosphoryl diester phosphodiesterase [Atopostipes suicloacalis DSM 15692]
MKKALKILGLLIAMVAAAWLVIFMWPVKARPERAFYRADDPEVLVIAHRGGRGLAPEGTLTAFDHAVSLGADVLEFDTHLTKDGHLVVIHDNTVDRTTNGTGKINEMTLEEVQDLDAGYQFTNEKDEYVFRDQGIYIPTVEEVFQKYPNMRFLIELKDTNAPEMYEEMIQELWHLIQNYQMEDNVMVGSFAHEINERFEEVSKGNIPIGAGEEEVRDFATKHVARLNGLAASNVDSLQLPTEGDGFDLTSKNIIQSAKARNISVYYWTINDKETMNELIDKKVNGIMTDYPDLLIEVLEERNE